MAWLPSFRLRFYGGAVKADQRIPAVFMITMTLSGMTVTSRLLLQSARRRSLALGDVRGQHRGESGTKFSGYFLKRGGFYAIKIMETGAIVAKSRSEYADLVVGSRRSSRDFGSRKGTFGSAGHD
jgi:hypothetical protein